LCTRSEHPASPVLLTSIGPHRATAFGHDTTIERPRKESVVSRTFVLISPENGGSRPLVKAATRVHAVPPSQFDDRSRGRSLPEIPLVRCSTSQNFDGLLSCPNTHATMAPAILRETSRQTSYQMVRWVFRPYTQLRRTICTSVLRPASTTLSHGFAVAGNSSPPFGSRHRVLSLKTMSCD